MNCKIITNDISVSVLNIQRCKLSERSMDVESCHERGIMHWNAKADVKYCCFIDTARFSPISKWWLRSVWWLSESVSSAISEFAMALAASNTLSPDFSIVCSLHSTIWTWCCVFLTFFLPQIFSVVSSSFWNFCLVMQMERTATTKKIDEHKYLGELFGNGETEWAPKICWFDFLLLLCVCVRCVAIPFSTSTDEFKVFFFMWEWQQQPARTTTAAAADKKG